MLNAQQVKQIAYNLGADLCGIASIDRFLAAPAGYRPQDVFPACRSVISFACRVPAGVLACNSPIPYTRVRNSLTSKMDAIALDLCIELEKLGALCVPVPTNESQWDEGTGRWRSIVSQKHAAQAAGLGTIGRHSLLMTREFGAMVWLGAVLCDRELESDPLKPNYCNDCGLCVKACPVQALDGELLDQQACWDHAFGEVKDIQTWAITCHRCRDACPYNLGSENAKLMKKDKVSAPIDVTGIRLETQRLILRPVAMEDLDDFHEYASDPQVAGPGGWTAYGAIEESREHLIKIVDSKECLALVYKENGKMLGTIALQTRDWEKYPLDEDLRGREFGFEINRAYWGQGLMPEAVMAVIDFCFRSLNYDFVTCGHFFGNEKSARTIQKCGFAFLFDGADEIEPGRTEQIRTYIRYNPGKEGKM